MRFPLAVRFWDLCKLDFAKFAERTDLDATKPTSGPRVAIFDVCNASNDSYDATTTFVVSVDVCTFITDDVVVSVVVVVDGVVTFHVQRLRCDYVEASTGNDERFFFDLGQLIESFPEWWDVKLKKWARSKCSIKQQQQQQKIVERLKTLVKQTKLSWLCF